MKTEIVIDQEFKKLCPPLSASERELLERSILEHGCRDPLVVWGSILLDGHNRYEICTKHNKPFKTHSLQFQSREDARQWLLTNQLGRRNLSPVQASYLRGCYYRTVRNPNIGGRRGKGTGTGVATQDILARQFAVSSSTIRCDVWIADAIDKLPPASRAFVFDPDVVARRQHIIDLSNIAKKAQPKVIKAAKNSGGEGLRKVMVKLRGKAVPGAHGVRCKNCGARLAPGVTTCLSCDLKATDIERRLAEPIDDEPDDESWKDRLARIQAAKQSGDEISYYANAIISFVENNEIERNTTEHKAMGRLLKVLKAKLGHGKFNKLWPSQSA